jgi:hypothetical protein
LRSSDTYDSHVVPKFKCLIIILLETGIIGRAVR